MKDELPELPEIEPHEKVGLLPSWGDPRFCISSYQVTPTVVPLLLGVIKQVASNNPRRWAIGFQQDITAAPTTLVGITTDLTTFGQQLTTNFRDNWFTQFVYGPMVQMEWYIVAMGNCNILLYEVELQ